MSPWHELNRVFREIAPEYTVQIVADGIGPLQRLRAACRDEGGLRGPDLPGFPADGDPVADGPGYRLAIPAGILPFPADVPRATDGKTIHMLRDPGELADAVRSGPAGIFFSLAWVFHRPGGFLLLPEGPLRERLPEWPVEGNPDHRGVALNRCCRDILDLPRGDGERPGADEGWVAALRTAAESLPAWQEMVWKGRLPLVWLLDAVRLHWGRGGDGQVPAPLPERDDTGPLPGVRILDWL